MKKYIANFALEPGKNTLEQFEHCTSQEFVVKAALMPDAHSGYVAPIGSVLVTKDYIVPSWVGFDIGCGMTAARLEEKSVLEKIKDNANEVYSEVRRLVPMGMGKTNPKNAITPETKKEFEALVEKFKKGPYEKGVLQYIESKAIESLGSLGHGNHFIEIGEEVLEEAKNGNSSGEKKENPKSLKKTKNSKENSKEPSAWIVVHSGSRGVGFKIAERYMKKSAGNEKQFEQTFPIQKDSDVGKEYLNVLDFGLGFALLNRKEMIRKTIIALENVLGKKVPYELWVNKNHNHAILDPKGGLFIHRKGATPAKKGERGVIPGNMRDGSFLVIGKGSKKFLESSSHGAGRLMSRTDAKEKFSMEEFEKSMEGIKGTVETGTLDELPMAYKNIYDVMEAQRESVEIVCRIRPLINWKGSNRGK